MKIMFYGAGPMGSLYRTQLKESGQEVTVPARGRRLSDLREHGIVLKDSDTGQRTSARANLLERLAPEDAYDLVVVLLRNNQVSDILPLLAGNRPTPFVLCPYSHEPARHVDQADLFGGRPDRGFGPAAV